MKTKILAIIITTIIALNMIGISYACWFKPPNCGYYYYNVRFVNVTWSDNEKVKDVGNVWANITDCGRRIDIFITNAYPCYEAYVNFTIKNKGDKTIHIYSVSLENPNLTALEVTVTNLTCTNLLPCDEAKGVVTTHILQTAQQCHTYTFKITIQLREAVGPGTPGFWKHQFEAQIDPDSLESYLDQINASSKVFNGSFTGSRKDKFQTALYILSVPKLGSKLVQLKAQLLALWLNYVSGLANGYYYEGHDAWYIIQGSEDAITAGNIGTYTYWKNLCDGFNNL